MATNPVQVVTRANTVLGNSVGGSSSSGGGSPSKQVVVQRWPQQVTIARPQPHAQRPQHYVTAASFQHQSPRAALITPAVASKVFRQAPPPMFGAETQTPRMVGSRGAPTKTKAEAKGKEAEAGKLCHQVIFLHDCPDMLRRHRMQLMDLPPELLQEMAAWLPSFGMRAQLRALCRSCVGLVWQQGAPYHVNEELSSFSLGDLGTCAVALSLRMPQNAFLRELCLGGNGITDAGVEALAMVLASPGSKLRRLSLRDNLVTDRGANALVRALSLNSTLEELDLWGNCLSDKGKQAIVAAAKCEVFLEVPRTRSTGSHAVNPRMRAILFDWISQVHTGVNTSTALDTSSDPQDMLFRTFSHIDAYLCRRLVTRAELQLVGVACTLVAAAGHEAEADLDTDSSELAEWLAFITDGACTPEEIREVADEVRQTLVSELHQPTAYTFLRRYLRQTGWTEESFSLANYLVELAALDASFLEFRPQAVAAAAAILSRQYLSQGVSVRHMPRWKAKLLRYAHVDLQLELSPCTAAMSRLHAAQQSSSGSTMFVNKKYEWSRLHMVAKLVPNPPCDADYFACYLSADA